MGNENDKISFKDARAMYNDGTSSVNATDNATGSVKYDAPDTAFPSDPADSISAEPPAATENSTPTEQPEASDPVANDNRELLSQLREMQTVLLSEIRAVSQQNLASARDLQQTFRLNSSDVALSQLSKSVASLEEKSVRLEESATREEKANLDMLREVRNFQLTTRNRLQEELDGYRKMHASTVFAPLLTGFANIYIHIYQLYRTSDSPKLQEQLMTFVMEPIEELMEEYGVEMHTTNVGETRSIRTCTTRKTVKTGNADLHGKVAYSDNPSFVLGNMVLIKERVDTYIYEPEADAPQSESAAENSEILPDSCPSEEPANTADEPAEQAETEKQTETDETITNEGEL